MLTCPCAVSRTRHYKVITVEDATLDSPSRVSSKRLSSDDSEVMDLNMKRVSTDLMGDPDIQNVFKKSYSLEDLTVPLDEEEEGDEEEAGESIEIGKDVLVRNFVPGNIVGSEVFMVCDVK